MARTALARTAKQALSKYDPQKGVKTIAVAEAAVKHWARAKDAKQLEQAIRAKLQAQAEFVFWWDSREKNKGTRGQLIGKGRIGNNRSVTANTKDDELAERLGTSLMRISRWRRKLNDRDDFESVVQQQCLRQVKTLEFEPIDPQLKASDSNEWYTPAKYVEAARSVLGQIDLDPASSPVANRTVQASTFFSKDGLEREWPGCVWLNPPYGGLSGPFTARLIEQFVSGITTAAILLVNSNSTDAAWFQPLWDYLLCFTDHRINFTSPGGNESGSTHGSVFAYLGLDRAAFLDHFSQFGAVVERARP